MAAATEKTPAPRVVRGACPHDCPDTCSLLSTVENGRVVRVAGNPAHPATDGVLCTKVSRYVERLEHPERVLMPLRRTGPKGSGAFEPATWDEALDAIANRLAEIAQRNAEAIVPYSYAGTMGLVQGEGMAARFFHALGASRLDRTICASAGGEALAATYGAKVGMHLRFFAESRVILIWGSHSIASNLHFWRIAQEAKRNGAVLWCIDPRRTETADKCHHHVALKPGTDGALALALMHELVVHDRLDPDYLERHVQGWPELRARALEWPAERAAVVCGIDAGQIRALAHDYGTRAPAAIRLNYGMQRAHGGGSAVRLVALLPCLIGAWRHRAGGLLLSSSGWFRHVRADAHLQRPDLLGGRNPRTINMSTIGDALLHEGSAAFGPRIEALVVYNSNPVAVAPEGAKVRAGFRRDDLFTVVLEHFRTDTALHADWILPATMQMEHWDAHTAYGHTDLLLNRPAVEPPGQTRSNAAIFRALAERMRTRLATADTHVADPRFADPCFAETDEQMARAAFKPAQGADLTRLDTDGFAPLDLPDAPFADGGFFTPDGRAMAAPPGLGVADHVPNHECAERTPALVERYPLAMISPPPRNFLNSTFVNVGSLSAAEREPTVEIHPDDAAARGISSGQRVELFNDRGSYRCRAEVSGRARPGVVNALGLWWSGMCVGGLNVNALTSQALTDLGRAPTFYDCLVDVRTDA